MIALPDTVLTVRACVPEDRARLSHILLNSDVFGQHDADTVDEMFVQAMAKPGPDQYRFTVACGEDGEAVGFACYGWESMTQGTWDLFWVCALASARGRGVGRALLADAVATASAEGGRLMVIYTSSTPAYDGARRLYRSQGFEKTAVIGDYYAEGDDLNIFARRLRA
jgi:ribosomal protein S18 acetylase RimI-like enzyme